MTNDRRKTLDKLQGILAKMPEGSNKELLADYLSLIVQLGDRLDTVASAILAEDAHMSKEMAKGIKLWDEERR